MLAAAAVALGWLVGSQTSRVGQVENQAEQGRQMIRENRERIGGLTRELGRAASIGELSQLITVIERLTGAQDAGNREEFVPSGEAEPSPSPARTAFPRPRPSPPLNPLPEPTPSPGTLKPILCAMFPDTMALIGVNCRSDTFIVCDLAGLSCPAPPRPPSPPR